MINNYYNNIVFNLMNNQIFFDTIKIYSYINCDDVESIIINIYFVLKIFKIEMLYLIQHQTSNYIGYPFE